MNEFIVWDKELKQFNVWSDNYFIFQNGTIGWISIEGIEREENSIALPYIGKTDINGKKIYADCSIVEFDFRYIEICDLEPWKLVGYFKFNINTLRYEIKILDIKNENKIAWRSLDYDEDLMSNIKIIDTVQENKLGLIK